MWTVPSGDPWTARSARAQDLGLARWHVARSRAGRAGPADRGCGRGWRSGPRGGPRGRRRGRPGGRAARCGRRRGGGCRHLADRRWPDGARLGGRARSWRRVRGRRGRRGHAGRRTCRWQRLRRRYRCRRTGARAGTGAARSSRRRCGSGRRDRHAGCPRGEAGRRIAQPADRHGRYRENEIHHAQCENEARTLGGRHGSPGSPMVRSPGPMAWSGRDGTTGIGRGVAWAGPVSRRARPPRGARIGPGRRLSGSRRGRDVPHAT
jgi:hypothetical protein